MYDLRRKRWFRALQIAEVLFEDEGYHTKYIKDLRDFLTNERGNHVSETLDKGGPEEAAEAGRN